MLWLGLWLCSQTVLISPRGLNSKLLSPCERAVLAIKKSAEKRVQMSHISKLCCVKIEKIKIDVLFKKNDV